MKKWIAFMLAALLCLGLTACGGGGSDPSETEDGVTEISWWTNYGSTNVANIQVLVDKYNVSQEQYHVTIVRQGGANELKAKLRSTRAENLPTMFSGTPATTCFYTNSDFTACFQDFIDADSDPWTATLYDTVRTTYSDPDGKMWGYPFGVSAPGLYVNEDILAAAGYQASDITSFVKVAEIATAVVKGGYAKYGLGISKDGAYLNYMMALEGVPAVDQDNGYSGTPTKCVYNEGATLAALTEGLQAYASLYQNNVAVPYGTDVNGELIPLFAAGDVAMFIYTSSGAAKLLDLETNINFTFVPIVGLTENTAHSGAITAGTGNYICSAASERAQQGAYEFIKWLAHPENQAFYCMNTGYVPYTPEATNYEEYQTWMHENFPESETLLRSMLDNNAGIRLPYISVATDQINANSGMWENIYTNPNGDIRGYIDTAAGTINDALEIAAMIAE
ncbi:MAG: extracellular solute-binding protein [Oscillospiraceae bacterium]|nr:extracellular solute-binding protein [Oscillospiraceae bacterium]